MSTVKWATDLQPVSALKARGNELLNQVDETGRTVILTRHGCAVAAVVPIADFEANEELADLLALRKAIAEAEVAIQEGRTRSHDEVKAMWAERLRDEQSHNMSSYKQGCSSASRRTTSLVVAVGTDLWYT